MGTSFDMNNSLGPEQVGIIPRAIQYLFDGIHKRKEEAVENNRSPPEFKVHCQFIEVCSCSIPCFCQADYNKLVSFWSEMFRYKLRKKMEVYKTEMRKKITFLIAGHYNVFENKKRVLLNFVVMRKLPNTLTCIHNV